MKVSNYVGFVSHGKGYDIEEEELLSQSNNSIETMNFPSVHRTVIFLRKKIIATHKLVTLSL
jgi:hypothetical protein